MTTAPLKPSARVRTALRRRLAPMAAPPALLRPTTTPDPLAVTA